MPNIGVGSTILVEHGDFRFYFNRFEEYSAKKQKKIISAEYLVQFRAKWLNFYRFLIGRMFRPVQGRKNNYCVTRPRNNNCQQIVIDSQQP
jgi:hypothetical protein